MLLQGGLQATGMYIDWEGGRARGHMHHTTCYIALACGMDSMQREKEITKPPRCLYAYIYMYTADNRYCVHMYTNLCVFICMHIYMCIYIHVCVHAYMPMRMGMHMCIYTRIRYTYVYIYTHTHI